MANNCRVFLVLSLLVSFSAHASLVVSKNDVSAPSRFGNLSLSHNGNEFYVSDDTSTSKVERWNLDKDIRGKSSQDIAKYLALGARFNVNKLDNGEYKVNLNGRLNGGGPIAGWVAYGVVWGAALTTLVFQPHLAPEIAHLAPEIEQAARLAQAGATILPTP